MSKSYMQLNKENYCRFCQSKLYEKTIKDNLYYQCKNEKCTTGVPGGYWIVAQKNEIGMENIEISNKIQIRLYHNYNKSVVIPIKKGYEMYSFDFIIDFKNKEDLFEKITTYLTLY